MPSNQWGPFYTTATGAGSGAVNNPSLQTPPQSPSGSVTGQAATFNSANTITSTKEFLDNIINVESAQQGAPAISNTASVILAGQTAGGTQFYKWS